jgi:DNA-binding transcriptional LysR family regulator
MPELRHFRYFVAVAEELNFSRAARRLRMAQPPLSAAIRQLESELGTELFRRTSREVALTEAGRVLLDGARRTLAEADQAVTATRRTGEGKLGRLRIGFSWSARFETLPALGQAFRAARPDVELLTEEMWNARMIEALRAGVIDLAVSLCPEIGDAVSYVPVRSERVVAVLASSHPCAGSGSVRLADLADESFVLFPREYAPRLYDQLVGLCRAAGFEPVVRKESFHAGWELGLLADEHVVSLTPESVGRDLPGGLVAVPLHEPQQELETQALSRPDDPSPAVASFLEVVPTVFASTVAADRPSSPIPDSSGSRRDR